MYTINVIYPGGSVVKNLPAMQETWVRFLGWDDPLKKGILHCSGLEKSVDRGAWWAIAHGVTKSWT